MLRPLTCPANPTRKPAPASPPPQARPRKPAPASPPPQARLAAALVRLSLSQRAASEVTASVRD
jgi:hypothetical protein